MRGGRGDDAGERVPPESAPAAACSGAGAPHQKPLGAILHEDGRCEFRVWAPRRRSVDVRIIDGPTVAMRRGEWGYFEAVLDGCTEGTRYVYLLDGSVERPDPASRSQPDGVHAPSEVVGRDFAWRDAGWRGLPLDAYVVYELHVGTFTEEGTLDAIVPRLPALKETGITAIELMPVGQFPGGRNWGYDGVYAGAVQNSYGGPRALKRLVDAAHAHGLAVVLDVVYNHLGPEGNYLSEYGPYFTDRYRTPWGEALNFDGPSSDPVRWLFIHNALMWIDEFHIDALRVDAVHAIVDHSAGPFLQELTAAVRACASASGRHIHTIAESDLDDPRVITPKERFGLGFDAQWSDDFHHSLHAILTGERDGYYLGFGNVSDLARVLKNGYLWTGQYNAYRDRRYGLKPETVDGTQFVVCAQNHDQVGNRMTGERLAVLVPEEDLRLAAAAVILSPFVPMLFMGEEYGETAPFQYFTSHSDPALIEAVRKGRREEFDDFAWRGEPPDPQDEETFLRSKIRWHLRESGHHAGLLRLHRELLRLRRENPALRTLDLSAVETHADDESRTLLLLRRAAGQQALIAFNFDAAPHAIAVPDPRVPWTAALDTPARLAGGRIELPPKSFSVCFG
ncbi:MAG TPA: malto-oligosyltrehalose trehalohydrolase [Thermoanaerobaculia bacterium]|nr:malto-oligosyltrehalose trehalohydrolase [Thermoanaerobaculia bacterium]